MVPEMIEQTQFDLLHWATGFIYIVKHIPAFRPLVSPSCQSVSPSVRQSVRPPIRPSEFAILFLTVSGPQACFLMITFDFLWNKL